MFIKLIMDFSYLGLGLLYIGLGGPQNLGHPKLGLLNYGHKL